MKGKRMGTVFSSRLRVFCFRLEPGDDLRGQLKVVAQQHGWRAGFVISVVGSLQRVALRPAGRTDLMLLDGDYEILALGGTFAEGGAIHLHLTVADARGCVRGGHLVDGSIVRTTAELVVGEAEELVFDRSPDAATGFRELAITAR